MEDALTQVADNMTEGDYTIVLTDSLSLVSKLQTGHIKKEWLSYIFVPTYPAPC